MRVLPMLSVLITTAPTGSSGAIKWSWCAGDR